MKFRLDFTGRRIGAIGIFYRITLIVEASNPEGAAWKAYETHEHIYLGVDGVLVTPMPIETPVSTDDPSFPYGPNWDLGRRVPGQQRLQVDDTTRAEYSLSQCPKHLAISRKIGS